jgi:hypothetical protein
MMKARLFQCSASFRLLALVAVLLSFTQSLATAENQGSSSTIRRISSVQRAAAVALDPAIATTCPVVNLTLGANETANGGGTVKDVDSFYKCLEGIYKCGENGYILDSLASTCRAFYYDTRPKMSTKGRIWVDNTLVCFQESILTLISTNSTCADVEAAAFTVGVPCFETNGFCELSLRDKLAAFRTSRPLESLRSRQGRQSAVDFLRMCL